MLIGLFHQTTSGSGATRPYAFPNTLAESYQMAGFRTLLSCEVAVHLHPQLQEGARDGVFRAGSW